jgi:hypothetical protein
VAGNLERSGVSELVGTSCTENRKRAALLDVLAALANKGHDTRAIQAGSAIGRLPARPSTQRWRLTGSRTSGGSDAPSSDAGCLIPPSGRLPLTLHPHSRTKGASGTGRDERR